MLKTIKKGKRSLQNKIKSHIVFLMTGIGLGTLTIMSFAFYLSNTPFNWALLRPVMTHGLVLAVALYLIHVGKQEKHKRRNSQ